jgi:hypothetical protein
MDDRAGRREIGAWSGILFPLLFDIDGYLKRYAGGLVGNDLGSCISAL